MTQQQRPNNNQASGFEQWLAKIACWPHVPPQGAGLDYVIPVDKSERGGDR